MDEPNLQQLFALMAAQMDAAPSHGRGGALLSAPNTLPPLAGRGLPVPGGVEDADFVRELLSCPRSSCTPTPANIHAVLCAWKGGETPVLADGDAEMLPPREQCSVAAWTCGLALRRAWGHAARRGDVLDASFLEEWKEKVCGAMMGPTRASSAQHVIVGHVVAQRPELNLHEARLRFSGVVDACREQLHGLKLDCQERESGCCCPLGFAHIEHPGSSARAMASYAALDTMDLLVGNCPATLATSTLTGGAMSWWCISVESRNSDDVEQEASSLLTCREIPTLESSMSFAWHGYALAPSQVAESTWPATGAASTKVIRRRLWALVYAMGEDVTCTVQNYGQLSAAALAAPMSNVDVVARAGTGTTHVAQIWSATEMGDPVHCVHASWYEPHVVRFLHSGGASRSAAFKVDVASTSEDVQLVGGGQIRSIAAATGLSVKLVSRWRDRDVLCMMILTVLAVLVGFLTDNFDWLANIPIIAEALLDVEFVPPVVLVAYVMDRRVPDVAVSSAAWKTLRVLIPLLPVLTDMGEGGVWFISALILLYYMMLLKRVQPHIFSRVTEAFRYDTAYLRFVQAAGGSSHSAVYLFSCPAVAGRNFEVTFGYSAYRLQEHDKVPGNGYGQTVLADQETGPSKTLWSTFG